MVTPGYCVLMARYNAWQNAAATSAAAQLSDQARRAERGAYFGSLMGTFNHLLWGDLIWMSRFDGGAAPGGGIAGSPGLCAAWDELVQRRAALDARILEWALGLDTAALEGDLAWHSGALGRDVTRPLGLCIAHFFNHQTHHRGQIHAMLTAAGVRTNDTDLFAMPDEAP